MKNDNVNGVNSLDYWDTRFSSLDWEQYEGEKQSSFFSQVLIDNLPDWLINELHVDDLQLADVGCAMGAGTALFASIFLGASVTGYDFSSEAVSLAKKHHPFCNFEVLDIVKDDLASCDVVISSNTLEHLEYPIAALRKLCAAAKKYAILILPFEDSTQQIEHRHSFFKQHFPFLVEGCGIEYFRVIDTSVFAPTYWPGKQILLVYSSLQYRPRTKQTLELYYQGFAAQYENQIVFLEEKLGSSLEEKNKIERDLKVICEERDSLEFLQKELDDTNQRLFQTARDYENEHSSRLELEKQLDSKHSSRLELQQQFDSTTEQLNSTTEQLNSTTEQLVSTTEQLNAKQQALIEAENYIRLTIEQNKTVMSARMFRLAHFWSRLKRQLFMGSLREKKAFFRWFAGKRNDNDRRFQPLFSVQGLLEQALIANGQQQMQYQNNNSEPYRLYDVIILSVIDFDFRYQRPQHFAASFAASGHRVFYVNANFHNTPGSKQIKPNLFTVNLNTNSANAIYETDWSENRLEMEELFASLLAEHNIRDAVVIVDYPNWLYAATYMRSRYGFKLVVDYMDDFTGFIGTADERLKHNCIELLQKGDGVVASSNFLYNIAKEYNNHTTVIRNGTEFEHFHVAAESTTDKKSRRKVIGYYGAVAEWFDAEKICFLAQHMPNCDIVIIGRVTENEALLASHKNVKLLGEKPYAELPRYLADFDVCVIPFDTSTDLIKATNPVKFYEYLSAGKKIVATEIPELEPYRDKYVYMANDNDVFLQYVKACIANEDTLESPAECMKFGQENDWSYRYTDFERFCSNLVPKVSVIVLTYNNLGYNKLCINSILTQTAYPRYELIVVDNNSSDGTKEYLEQLQKLSIPNVTVVLNDENLGFAAGNNVGLQKCDGDIVVLLNNDTVVTRGWLTALVKHCNAGNDIGMCGAVTNSIGNEGKINVEYAGLQKMYAFANRYTWQHMGHIYPNPKVLAFFCVAIRREVLDKVGFLDENYGRGMFEDDDYAQAVRKAGYRLCIAEDCFVHHFHSVSLNQMASEEHSRVFNENKSYYEKKWNTTWKGHNYRWGVGAENNGVIEL